MGGGESNPILALCPRPPASAPGSIPRVRSSRLCFPIPWSSLTARGPSHWACDDAIGAQQMAQGKLPTLRSWTPANPPSPAAKGTFGFQRWGRAVPGIGSCPSMGRVLCLPDIAAPLTSGQTLAFSKGGLPGGGESRDSGFLFCFSPPWLPGGLTAHTQRGGSRERSPWDLLHQQGTVSGCSILSFFRRDWAPVTTGLSPPLCYPLYSSMFFRETEPWETYIYRLPLLWSLSGAKTVDSEEAGAFRFYGKLLAHSRKPETTSVGFSETVGHTLLMGTQAKSRKSTDAHRHSSRPW